MSRSLVLLVSNRGSRINNKYLGVLRSGAPILVSASTLPPRYLKRLNGRTPEPLVSPPPRHILRYQPVCELSNDGSSVVAPWFSERVTENLSRSITSFSTNEFQGRFTSPSRDRIMTASSLSFFFWPLQSYGQWGQSGVDACMAKNNAIAHARSAKK